MDRQGAPGGVLERDGVTDTEAHAEMGHSADTHKNEFTQSTL